MQKIRATLELVQGALAATQKAPERLSPEKRRRAILVGMAQAVREMRAAIDAVCAA